MEGQSEVRCDQNTCLIEDRVISYVNEVKPGWIARNYSEFWGRTLKDGMKLRLGTLNPSHSVCILSTDYHILTIICLQSFIYMFTDLLSSWCLIDREYKFLFYRFFYKTDADFLVSFQFLCRRQNILYYMRRFTSILQARNF